MLTSTWRTLRGHVAANGYITVSLRRNGRTYPVNVHTLVLLAFVGPRPEGMEACHNNGTRIDNRLSNLRWDTHVGNVADTDRAPTVFLVALAARSQDSQSLVQWMRRKAEEGMPKREIARAVGVASTTATSAIRGDNWAMSATEDPARRPGRRRPAGGRLAGVVQAGNVAYTRGPRRAKSPSSSRTWRRRGERSRRLHRP